ncbi:MAG: hypothetical protein IJM08_03605 [Firmicutes bacterium]|nr:hypothetical protein [Bacillota bacterium]
MKRKISVILVIIMVFSAIANAHAATNAIGKSSTLSFSGTTANCAASISQAGASCTLTVELYRGGTRVAYWYDADIGSASVSDTVSGCISGQTYTLRVSGTVDGVSVYYSPITKTCP